MQERSDRKIIIFFFVTTIIVLLLAWLVIFLLGNKVKQTFESYQKEKLNSFVIEEKRNKILKMEKELPDLEEEKNNLDSMLVKKDASLPLLRTLEKVAGDTGCQIKIDPVEISKIKFEKKASSAAQTQDDELAASKKQDQGQASEEKNKKEDDLAPLKDYPAFSVEVTGHFSSVVDFFEKFENMPYFTKPLIVDIASEEKKSVAAESAGTLEAENTDENNIKMKITFAVYGG